MPVAAVAETVAVSTMFEVFKSAFDEVPAKVCNAVNVVAVPGATKSVPAVAAVNADVPLPFNTPVTLVVTLQLILGVLAELL